MHLDAGSLALMMPIVAIVGALSTRVVGHMIWLWGRIIQHREQMASIKAANPTANNSDVSSEVEQLRNEIAKLRDTSTQYDLSIDHHLQEIDQRLNHLETRRASYQAHVETEPTQQLNRPNS